MAMLKTLARKFGGCKQIKDYLARNGRAVTFRSSSIDLNSADWDEQMDATRQIFGKDKGRKYYHFVISPDPEDGLDANAVDTLAYDWVRERYSGYQWVIETHSDNGIPLYDIEFETDYGDYDFEVAMADGRIVGADYEVDEEWLDALGGSPVTAEEATSIVAGKVSGASAADVSVWEESGDGRGRYEGELFLDGMKYEFELDPRTGRIFDWTADLRD